MKKRKLNKVKVFVVVSTIVLACITPVLVTWCNTSRDVKTFGGEAFVCVFPALLYCLSKSIKEVIEIGGVKKWEKD